MRPIKIHVSDDTDVCLEISRMNNKIPESIRNSPEFIIIYPQVTACIEDFSHKAKKLARTGTTIHIKKEFSFPKLRLLVILDYPKKQGFLETLSKFLTRG